PACSDDQSGSYPVARSHPGEDKRLLNVLRVTSPSSEAGTLLRGIAQQQPHLLWTQGRSAPGGRRGAESWSDAVRAVVTLVLIPRSAHGHRKAWADVVPKRHGPQEMR